MKKTKKPTKMAIAYLRVSTNQQAETGHGLELQEAAIRTFALHQGYEIVQVFTDAYSAMGKHSFLSRPGARAALELSHSTGWPIIVDELSRWVRNVKGLEQMIRDEKLNIISTREGVGISHAAVMSTAARRQREGELIGESTRKALQERKARGVLLGNRRNLSEAQAKGTARNKARAARQVVELAPVIEDLRRSGRTTARSIAEGLNERGHRTARRGAWNATNIRRLLAKVAAADMEAPLLPLTIDLRSADPRPRRCQDNPLWGAF